MLDENDYRDVHYSIAIVTEEETVFPETSRVLAPSFLSALA